MSTASAAISMGFTVRPADGQSRPEAIAFDIPAQPLAAALEAYSVIAGREVVYNGKLAVGRQSVAVQGSFTPEAALQRLLEGSGLTPTYMAADAFVLAPTPAEQRTAGTASTAAVAQYYGLIQSGLRQAFCADSHTRPGSYRVAASFWIGSDGRVSRTKLLAPTGAKDLDAKIESKLRSLAIGAAPPSGFAQPITLVIMPQAPSIDRDCQLARAHQPPGERAQ